jgi:hypothetical protein
MADYLVRAKAAADLAALRARMDDGEIAKMRPFGAALDFSLRNAKVEDDGSVTWEENDYCTPPLAMERAAVLDHYFTDLRVERVAKGDGWARIDHLPSLWTPST